MKHQLALSHVSQGALQKELQEKADMCTLLQEELQLSHNQTYQAREEVHVFTVCTHYSISCKAILFAVKNCNAIIIVLGEIIQVPSQCTCLF